MNNWRAHIAVFGANLIYGINYTVAKGVMPDFIKPKGFIALRVIGALLLFWLVRMFMAREKIEKKDWPRLIACGLFGVAINQTLFFEGLNLTSEVNASLIMTSNPVIVLLMAAFIIGEKVTMKKIAGIALGAVGAILLILGNQNSALTGGGWLGDLFIFINATSYAIYLVIVKPLMKKYNFITIISWAFLFGSIAVVPLGFTEVMEIEWSTMPTGILLSVLYVIICTTFLAYLLNIYGLRSLNPSNVSSYIYLQPVLAIAFTLIVAYNEKVGDLSWEKAGCAMLIFIGVYLVSSQNKKALRAN